MSTLGLMLLVSSAVCWSGFDFVRKQLTKSFGTWHLAFLLHAGQLPLFLLWALLIPIRFEWSYLPYGFLMIAVSGLASACFLSSIRLGDLSKTVPLLAFSPVFSAMNGWFILGEATTMTQKFGIGLVFTGAMLMHAPKKIVVGFSQSLISAMLMLFTAFLWSTTTVLDKKALMFANPALHGLFENAGAAIVIGIALRLLNPSRRLSAIGLHKLYYAFACFFASLALGLQFLAITEMPVAVFDSGKRCIGTLASLYLGKKVFQEEVSLRHWIAALALCVGMSVLILV